MWETLDRIDSPEDFIYDPSLVLYAPLHKKDGSSFMSDDAYGHLCTVTGALWTSQGRDFDGIDDVINCGNNPVLALQYPFTIEYWLKIINRLATDASGNIVHKSYNFISRISYGATLAETKGAFFRITPNSNFLTASYLPYPDWGHFTTTFDGENIRFFINGQFDVAHAHTDQLATSTNELQIGFFVANERFVGSIGEVRIYNQALTPLEIQRNYLASKWRYK